MSTQSPFFTFDISRLLSRSRALVPTGIDRVELEYARYWRRHARGRLEFAAVHPLGRFAVLPFRLACDFIDAIGDLWDNGGQDGANAARLGMRLLHGIMLPRMEFKPRNARRDPAHARSVYLLLSHHHLTRPELVRAGLKRRGALFIPLVHDLIPLEFPEYSRAQEPPRHLKRIETVVSHADAVITPSDAVRQSLLPYFQQAGRPDVPIWPVPLGVHPRAMETAELPPTASDRPYFICLGTIEARKNHLLLLNIWRRLVEKHGQNAPRLILIGKRGWENEQVIDMLERAPALQGVVEEHNALPDAEVVQLLTGAQALLFPSFAEGFGLPLAEAIALGTPALCSDLPVFRETGGDAVTYLDPLDGPAWTAAIEALSQARPAHSAAARPARILSWQNSAALGLQQITSFVGAQS